MHKLFAVLLSIALLSGTGVYAHLPAMFGKTFVRVEPDALPSPPDNEPQQDRSTPEDCEEKYPDRIKQMEQSGGPYDRDLVEPLWSLGRCYQSQKHRHGVEDYFEKALHIMRVNDGLYSQHQIPLVRELMAIYRKNGDKPALDRTHDYLFRIHRNGQPPYSGERKKATLEYLRWQREAYALDFDPDDLKRLLDLYTTNKQLLENAELQRAENLPWFRELSMNQLYNLYLLMGDDLLVAKYVGSSNSDLNSGGHLNSPPHVRQGVANIQFSAVGKGRALIKSLIARTPETDYIERARLQLELGDWLQWNSEELGAKKAYLAVVALVQKAGRTDLIEAWMGEPEELPTHDAFGGEADSSLPLLKASYSVSKRGQVKNIEVTTADPDNAALTRRLRRLLRDSHFRPRYSTGGPEPADGLIRHYQLLD